ncbi:prepilin-type N-terminal cleavage/methylation domain-containing protein [Aquincola sp. S2]|uniref:Prepilin-type N-terminal cleavage/methylation domain-containing protein n=1 Tax=Pseudaquabacterium terrae TaxID=2732868 RepID=A0ABX2ER92_9BURK|nr:prepilin-type N-terminal cleavage/methylation domain-containing protein [Aquabacterium terrae]NRF71123.1 prepilin-type N-terminal cleavage/methylation domain-containing protein [Aquabacterium terrae]
MQRRHGTRGVTLVELVLVIVVGSVLAATLLVFLRPALEGYLAARARADLAAQADTALRRMTRDVRHAVPNSIRTPGGACFELVPSAGGGRYRAGPDTVNDAAPACAPAADCAAALDPATATAAFDVLSVLPSLPAPGDWVVVGNQSPGDVYVGSNRAAITALSIPAASFGRYRLAIVPQQFPLGQASGRFSLVPDAQQAVFYVCSGADGTLDAHGDGKGTLYRLKRYGFNAAYPAACPSAAGADVLATRVRACNFVYDPNRGATQQSGFVWMEITLARNGETAALAMGAHVENAP